MYLEVQVALYDADGDFVLGTQLVSRVLEPCRVEGKESIAALAHH